MCVHIVSTLSACQVDFCSESIIVRCIIEKLLTYQFPFSFCRYIVALKLLNQLIPPLAHDEQDIQLVLGKEKIIIDEPKLSFQFAVDILPALIQVCFIAKSICTALCISTK